jgi:galactokinase
VSSRRYVYSALRATVWDRVAARDPVAARRARHVVTENGRVDATVEALRSGDVAAIGPLFAASHDSLRDDYEVSSGPLDTLVEIARATPGVIGTRLTGAGFGGCTISLVRPAAVDALRANVERDYERATGLRPRVFVAAAAEGAGRVA